MFSRCRRRYGAVFLLSGLLGGLLPQAQAQVGKFEMGSGVESIRLPAQETVGLAHIALRHAFTPNFAAGLASYAAVRGERGGFITLGLTGQARWPLDARWSLEGGGFVGAGGGRGGYTLSGGGLMLRAHAGLAYDSSWLGVPGRWSAGVSHVSFPDGVIRSTQPYLAYALPFEALMSPGWQGESLSLDATTLERLAPRAHELALVGQRLRVAGSSRKDSGAMQGDFDLLGVEWRTALGPYSYARFATAGAAGGDATGYMQILAGAGWRVPLTPRLSAHAYAGVGAGGGGGVDTGGGFLADAGLALQAALGRHWVAELGVAHLRAPSASLRANAVALKLGYQWEGAAALEAPAVFEPHALRVRAFNQAYFQAADAWRAHHADQSVQNLGMSIDAFINPTVYLTGQGVAAWRGMAGAYMAGLVGVGARLPLSSTWSAEAEVLAGAAGGGGLAMGSGAAVQGKAGLVWQFTPAWSAHLAGGVMRAFDGSFRARTLELGLGYSFELFSARSGR